MKYARSRISSSEGSPDLGVGSACGDAEICVVLPAIPLVAAGFRGFLTAVARRAFWRLAVFFVAVGAPDAASGSLSFSTFFVFLGTANTVC
jgi:hypothetical protein